jgi:hypothetical protein
VRLLGFLNKPYSATHLRSALHALRLID